MQEVPREGTQGAPALLGVSPPTVLTGHPSVHPELAAGCPQGASGQGDRVAEVSLSSLLLLRGQVLVIYDWVLDILYILMYIHTGFPGGTSGKESTCNAGDSGSIPGSERSPGGGYCNPLLFSCLENLMDRGAW